jgi:hypothetical protein
MKKEICRCRKNHPVYLKSTGSAIGACYHVECKKCGIRTIKRFGQGAVENSIRAWMSRGASETQFIQLGLL